jgi:hypothetical protein
MPILPFCGQGDEELTLNPGNETRYTINVTNAYMHVRAAVKDKNGTQHDTDVHTPN